MIVPLWRALLPLALFAALGALFDWVLGLAVHAGSDRVVRVGRWILLGLASVFAFAIHPAVAALLLCLLWTSARLGPLARARRGVLRSLDRTVPPARWIPAVFAVVALVALVRPATPFYWDEFIWLAKARLESEGGWGALHRAALDTSADVIPSGYPLLWSLASSWLSAWGDSPETLSAGACAATLLCVFLYLDGAERAFGPGRARWQLAASLSLLGFAPLVFIHLRSAYVDLPVGLLAGALTFGYAADIERPSAAASGARPNEDDELRIRRGFAADASIAVVLTGLKDEGFAYAVAISVVALGSAFLAAGRDPRRWTRSERGRIGRPLVVLIAAALPFLGWRLLLLQHHVVDADHRLGAPDWTALGPMAEQLARAVTDWRSWGLLWPVTAGALLATALRRGTAPAAARLAAGALLTRVFVLFAAIVCAPPRVRVFAAEGTLFNRLLVQLAPASAGLVMLLLSDPMLRIANRGAAIARARSTG